MASGSSTDVVGGAAVVRGTEIVVVTVGDSPMFE
jgi:hypothetical protein